MSEPRFVVRELVGHLTMQHGNTRQLPGASYAVVDTRINCRTVANYRSETRISRAGEGDGRSQLGRDGARALADARAAELNAAYQREALSPRNGTAV